MQMPLAVFTSSPRVVIPGTKSMKSPLRRMHLVEIAEFLAVTKSRAQQLAGEDGFPAPVGRDGRSPF